jgi:hypothetical protein
MYAQYQQFINELILRNSAKSLWLFIGNKRPLRFDAILLKLILLEVISLQRFFVEFRLN